MGFQVEPQFKDEFYLSQFPIRVRSAYQKIQQ